MTHDLMANVAASVVLRPLFEEDRLDARFEILIIKLRSLRIGAPGSLRRDAGNKHVQQGTTLLLPGKQQKLFLAEPLKS